MPTMIGAETKRGPYWVYSPDAEDGRKKIVRELPGCHSLLEVHELLAKELQIPSRKQVGMALFGWSWTKSGWRRDATGTLGARLISARFRAGFTQERLAKASGVSQSALCRIEADERDATSTVLRALADALGTPIDDLVPKPS